jgi:hypothetical protein
VPHTSCPDIAFNILVQPPLVFDGLTTIETQHWCPPFVSSREHPHNATEKETQKGASGRRLILSSRRASPNHRPNNHPNHAHTANTPPTTIHKPSCSSYRPDRTTNSPSGGARHEHLISRHRTSTFAPVSNYRNPRGHVARLQRRNRCSH